MFAFSICYIALFFCWCPFNGDKKKSHFLDSDIFRTSFVGNGRGKACLFIFWKCQKSVPSQKTSLLFSRSLATDYRLLPRPTDQHLLVNLSWLADYFLPCCEPPASELSWLLQCSCLSLCQDFSCRQETDYYLHKHKQKIMEFLSDFTLSYFICLAFS